MNRPIILNKLREVREMVWVLEYIVKRFPKDRIFKKYLKDARIQLRKIRNTHLKANDK